ncbi:HAD family phosphatase [Microlunatus elymi]|uniref:HAD family phosphatase n=1 Tax=Microlunatus elymi TaxID=2596828 RepID=A0A516Q013_9ACTN|nr:HAD family phosphatase [Microlunatus elymi]QDP96766.1 HAD family phosphatase [Microlunatus elymi]
MISESAASPSRSSIQPSTSLADPPLPVDATVRPAGHPGSGLSAALWDFDGTLADTEPIWIAAEFELIPRLGGQWSHEHAHKLVGRSLLESAGYMADVIGRDDLRPEWIVDQLLQVVIDFCRRGPIPWCPGARELLESLRLAGVPCALVSASYRSLLDVIIEQLPAGSFAASVAGDEVSRGKPDPEPYLTACGKLGVQAQDCVAFEDSPPGARSAGDAGATVVVIENVVPVPAAPNQVRVSSLAELDAAAVFGLLRRDGDDAH